MILENEDNYQVFKYGDRLSPGLTLKIEHSVSVKDKADITELVKLPLTELNHRREDSVNYENVLFEQLQKAVGKWEEQAALTQLLYLALEYVKAPAVSHSSNRWVTDENGYNSISNAVYKMYWRVYEETRYNHDLKASLPVAWLLTWDVRVNPPTGVNSYRIATKIAGQDRKRFTDKAAMEKYMKGRIAVYSLLFTEITPPVPREYAKDFEVNGLLLPGYRLADNELGSPEVSRNQKDKGRAQGSEKESDGEKASVLEQIAADRERRKARGAGISREHPSADKKRDKGEEL